MRLGKPTVLFLLSVVLIIGCAGFAAREKLSPENCASCHSDSLVFKEWQDSGHANSLKTLLEDPNASSKCLKCHSADYKHAKRHFWIFIDPPLPENANDPVSCSICHKHDSGIENNLIVSADKICLDCHVMLCGG